MQVALLLNSVITIAESYWLALVQCKQRGNLFQFPIFSSQIWGCRSLQMWDRRRATRKQKRRQVIGWILMRVQVFIQLEETRLLLIIRRCSHASYSTNPADSFQLGLLDLHLQVDLCFLVDSSSNSRNMMPKQDLEATEDQISTIQVSSHGETVSI